MNQLIPIINELHDVFAAIGQPPLDLPQIVAIGAQSSGKTSVVEALVGKDFLPRGAGLVTRRPIILQLYHVPDRYAGSPGQDADSSAFSARREWVEFQHRPGQKVYDWDAVRQEIFAETERISGRNRGISAEPIMLKVYSPNVLNLTLVDLPGLTKVPTGDQPPDIETQLRAMCMEYISSPSAIILAVTAANTDVTNSDALQLAQSVDPAGDRTVGVLTKMDLMDDGTDAVDVLQSRIIPLKRGWVGVVSRSQRALDDGVPMADSQRAERNFFSTHPAYSCIADQCGSAYLATLLNSILLSHVRAALPEIKTQITQQMMNVRRELEALGDPVDVLTTANQSGALLALLAKFSGAFCDALEGRGSAVLHREELFGGARVQYIFTSIFKSTVERFRAMDGLAMDDIRHAIRNATGPKSALFVPEASFEALARRQLSLLEEPGRQCVQLVFAELMEVARLCVPPELQRFGDLHERVVEVVHNLLRRLLDPAKTMVTNLVHIERAFINCAHPDFVGGSEAVNHANSLMRRHDSGNSGAVSEADDRDRLRRFGDADTQRYIDSWFTASMRELERQRSLVGRGHGSTPLGASLPDHASISSASSSGNADSPGARHAGLAEEDSQLTTRGAWSMAAGALRPTRVDPRAKLSLQPPAPTLTCLGKPVSHRELYEVFTIITLLNSYFEVVRKTFVDMVPKIVMCYLVNQARDNVHSELIRVLYTDGAAHSLLRETDDVAERRRGAEDALACLTEAHRIVEAVRDWQAKTSTSAASTKPAVDAHVAPDTKQASGQKRRREPEVDAKAQPPVACSDSDSDVVPVTQSMAVKSAPVPAPAPAPAPVPAAVEVPGPHDIQAAPLCLVGTTFVVTGVLPSYGRREVQDIILRFGGRVTTSVSKKTTHLLVGDVLETGDPVEKSKKYKEAKLLGTCRIITEPELVQLLQTLPAGELPGTAVAKSTPTTRSPARAPSPAAAATSAAAAIVPAAAAAAAVVAATPSPARPAAPRRAAKQLARALPPAGAERKARPASDQWVDMYAPANPKELIGNAAAARRLKEWLEMWHARHVARTEPLPPQSGPVRPAENTGAKAALLSGPPGIGKTSAARILAEACGYEVMELNASDARSKSMIERSLGDVTSCTTLSFAPQKASAPGKRLIVMDEVDGMSSSDRGGNQALIQVIKTTRVPIVCICNDRQKSSVRTLANHCYDLKFQRPTKVAIAARMQEIAAAHGLQVEPNAMERLVESCGNDIRQVLHMLQMWRRKASSMTFADLSDAQARTSKDANQRLTFFDAAADMFKLVGQVPLAERMERFFVDYDMIPLAVQQTWPAALNSMRGESALSKVNRMAAAADAVAEADIMSSRLRSAQEWRLLPSIAAMNAKASYHAAGMVGFTGFPEWLGKNSARTKRSRLLSELSSHLNASITGGTRALRLDYLPVFRPRLLHPLLSEGADGIEEVIHQLDEYGLSKSDVLEVMAEFQVGSGKRDELMAGVSSKVKSALTRAYNSSSHKSQGLQTATVAKGKTSKAAATPEPAELDGSHASESESDASDDDGAEVEQFRVKARPARGKAAASKAGRKRARS